MKIFFILFLYISLINSQIIDYEKLVPIYRFYDIQEKSHYLLKKWVKQKIPSPKIVRIRRWNYQASLHPSYSTSSHPKWNDSTWQ